MKLRTILLFFFLLLSTEARAELIIYNWQENVQLTKSGRISEIFIQGKITNLAANMAMSSFAIAFDPKQNLRINKVINDNQLNDYSKNANFTFKDNNLTIRFPEGKRNGEQVSIYLAYTEYYDKINEFLRQESIYIPAFAAGANSKVTFNFPGYFESATFNPNVAKVGNSFVYSNVVPKNGVHEIIKLTPVLDNWDVAVKTTIRGNKSLGKINVKVPQFFQIEKQKVENYNITSSINSLSKKTDESGQTLSFNTASQELVVSSNAKIKTGLINRSPITRNPANYINYSAAESTLLTPILDQIRNDKSYGNIPLYAKIGKFVHDYLRYEISYVGKLPTLQQIVQNRIGVCTEYSRLFDALARVAGIPSIVIDGAACGEYFECQGHSWNLVYHQNKWIEVDPTWDLMSGVVSSSHVYFNDYNKGQTGLEYFDKNLQVQMKVELEMSESF